MNQLVLTPADSIIVVTDSTDELHTTAHFADRALSGQLTPDNQLGIINTVGNLELCAAPSAGTRLVKTVSVHNASLNSVTAHLAILRGSTVYRLATFTIDGGASYNP
jgi:hypothetical protein